MTRLGRRDGRGVESARTDGSAASVREQKRRVGYTDPTRATDRKTTGDRVFSIDESVTGGLAHTRVCRDPRDTFATIERPTPNVRRSRATRRM